MKVKCIAEYYEVDNCLTLGKTYDVIGIYYDYGYTIMCDSGYQWYCEKEFLKPLSEIRNDTINKLLEDEN